MMTVEAIANKSFRRTFLGYDLEEVDDFLDEIIRQMKAGIAADDMRKVLSITDRREAIRTAVALANKGDIILLAGKGHEDYQIIKGVKRHFDDKEELSSALKEK